MKFRWPLVCGGKASQLALESLHLPCPGYWAARPDRSTSLTPRHAQPALGRSVAVVHQYGVRKFSANTILNWRSACTFYDLAFSDYGRGAIRMAALMAACPCSHGST